VKLNLGETLIVEFCPLGVNEPRTGGLLLGFVVGTVALPGGSMALSVELPTGHTFEAALHAGEHPLLRYLIDNPGGANEMTFVLSEGAPPVELAVKRVTRKEHDETCCEGHCDR